LIENRTSYFSLICFLWVYHGHITWVAGYPRCLTFCLLFFNWFFFQLYPSILGWSGIRLHNFFYLFYKKLSRSHNSGYRFGRLTCVNSSVFLCHFLKKKEIQLYPLTLCWLIIELRGLLWFSFYAVILVSWLRFVRLTRIDLTYFFNWILFLISSFNIELIEN